MKRRRDFCLGLSAPPCQAFPLMKGAGCDIRGTFSVRFWTVLLPSGLQNPNFSVQYFPPPAASRLPWRPLQLAAAGAKPGGGDNEPSVPHPPSIPRSFPSQEPPQKSPNFCRTSSSSLDRWTGPHPFHPSPAPGTRKLGEKGFLWALGFEGKAETGSFGWLLRRRRRGGGGAFVVMKRSWQQKAGSGGDISERRSAAGSRARGSR